MKWLIFQLENKQRFPFCRRNLWIWFCSILLPANITILQLSANYNWYGFISLLCRMRGISCGKKLLRKILLPSSFIISTPRCCGTCHSLDLNFAMNVASVESLKVKQIIELHSNIFLSVNNISWNYCYTATVPEFELAIIL